MICASSSKATSLYLSILQHSHARTYHLSQSPAAAEPHEERKSQGLVVARDAEEEGHDLFNLWEVWDWGVDV